MVTKDELGGQAPPPPAPVPLCLQWWSGWWLSSVLNSIWRTTELRPWLAERITLTPSPGLCRFTFCWQWPLGLLTQLLESSWKWFIHLLCWGMVCPSNHSPGHHVAAAQISAARSDPLLKVPSCVIDTGTRSAAPPLMALSVSRFQSTSGRGSPGRRALPPGLCYTGSRCWFLLPSTSWPSSLCTRLFVNVSGWWQERVLPVI